MSSKIVTIFGCAAVLSFSATMPSRAEETPPVTAEAAADENKIDPALKAEIAYVEALVDCGFPDFAAPVIEATKKKWPEADALFFAIEIRGMLSLGQFEEAEKKIAALPDRNGSKYWAARLEVANNFFGRGKKKECSAIYDEFFKKFAKPPKELREFYMQACYAWGQILLGDRRFADAASVYERLLAMLNKNDDDEGNTWCNVACETSEMYLQMATAETKEKERQKILASAKKLVDQLLWEQGRPVYFGRAIAMKANIELLKGDVKKAQETIDEYMPQLADLHQQIVEFDPQGRNGLLKMSPMPLCRYMLAEMLWKEAQAEYQKADRNDERVKGLLFGEKNKNKGGKRNGGGAYNHSVNVFIKYPESMWAPQAGDMAEAIRTFAEENYKAKIKAQVTPEQMSKVREMQFRVPLELFGMNDYKGAITNYLEVLARYPEGKESIRAIENLTMSYLNLIARKQEAEDKLAEYRLDADAVEGYLAERFADHADNTVMILAGDAILRLAATEKQRGEMARADRLYKDFLMNYRKHVNAATTAASMAGMAQGEEKFADALALWDIVEKYYSNSVHYVTALVNASACHEKLGNRPAAIRALGQYCAIEKAPLKQLQAQMQLAQLYQKDGLEIFKSAETNETPEAAEIQLKKGSEQIIRGIKQFSSFAAAADKALASPSISAGDKKRYNELKEAALYLVGDCWSRLTKPEAKLDAFRKRAAESFEAYVKQCPKGMYAKYAYLKLASIYTALGEMVASKDALDRLSKAFPDSDEAKNAMPRLAKSLIEMGKVKEGTEIYANMLKTDGTYTAWHFVNAGEALITAKDWDLANRAFEKAVEKAGTNQMSTVARARIGQAKSLFKQKLYDEARNQIDMFLDDEKMARLAIAAEANLLMVEVASEQGRTEKNDQLRIKNFNAAVGAVKKLRTYWRNKPQHEQDVVDLMSADIVVKRMNAEDAMGLKDQARESCSTAAAMLQTFMQTHEPNAEHPFDKMSAGEQANLERCYATMVPLFSRLGADQADRVLNYGEAYLKYFPNGKARTEIINCINRAKSAGGAAAAAAAEEATEEATEEAPAAEATEKSAEEQPAPAATAAEPAAEAPAAEPAAKEAPAAEAPAAEKSENTTTDSQGEQTNE